MKFIRDDSGDGSYEAWEGKVCIGYVRRNPVRAYNSRPGAVWEYTKVGSCDWCGPMATRREAADCLRAVVLRDLVLLKELT